MIFLFSIGCPCLTVQQVPSFWPSHLKALLELCGCPWRSRLIIIMHVQNFEWCVFPPPLSPPSSFSRFKNHMTTYSTSATTLFHCLTPYVLLQSSTVGTQSFQIQYNKSVSYNVTFSDSWMLFFSCTFFFFSTVFYDYALSLIIIFVGCKSSP